jgi:hypothetical protein
VLGTNDRDRKLQQMNINVNKTGNVTLRRVCRTTVAVETQVLHILSVSVYLPLVTQHAKHMHYIIFSSMACLELHFSALSHKLHDF